MSTLIHKVYLTSPSLFQLMISTVY